MKDDFEINDYYLNNAKTYECNNYGRDLQGFVMRKCHETLESSLPSGISNHNVLEIGPGPHPHYIYLKNQCNTYTLLDRFDFTERIPNTYTSCSSINSIVGNALNINYPDSFFDRVISCHVLEHLQDPAKAIREWYRVTKTGGVISIALPCDPGLFWRVGRKLFVRPKKYPECIEYDYFMAKEHINSIFNLRSLIRYYFDNPKEILWPGITSVLDFNLFYIVHIRKYD